MGCSWLVWHFSVLPFLLLRDVPGVKVFNQLIVTAVLVLRMLPWEGRILLHRQRCENTWSYFFTCSGVGKVLLLLSPGRSGLCCKGKSGTQWDPRAVPWICAWTCHSRGKVLITQLLLADISAAVPFGRGKTIKQADMNNLLVCLADSCQDQQSHVIYLSTCVISFFFPPKEA